MGYTRSICSLHRISAPFSGQLKYPLLFFDLILAPVFEIQKFELRLPQLIFYRRMQAINDFLLKGHTPRNLIFLRTVFTSPIPGVVPPAEGSAQSSTLSAPASTAISADSRL